MSATTEVSSGVDRPVALGYHRPLDGLRGVALLAIIVYHSGLSVASGAFLAVSTFFTLSGFLITSLLLAEHSREGAISLRGFWERRLRRLLPAALAAISLIAIAAVFLADTTQWLRLRADALSSLFYVANWRFILAGDSYGASFASPSPYTHFWSLAIEEQFYMLLPVVVLGALAVSRSRRVLGWVLGGLVATSIVWANWLVSSGASVDRMYFGTEVRLPELVSGALLALWWMRREEPLGKRSGRLVGLGGLLALVVMVLAWMTVRLDQRWLYRGGLTLYSGLTILVVIAAMVPGSPVARILGWRPLVWVGVLSYAGYLLHYPILLWLRQDAGVGDLAALAIAVPLTFLLAVASRRYIERPVREGRRIAPARAYLAAAVGMVVVAALVLALTGLFRRDVSAGDVTNLDQDRWQQLLEATAAQEASDAPRINTYGDSSALVTGSGLSEVSRAEPDVFVAQGGWADLGCGLLTGNQRRVRGEVVDNAPNCATWPQEWAATSASDPADVAVIEFGAWEVVDQQLVPGGEFLSVGDSEALRAEMKNRLSLGVETLLEDNGMVVLLNPPDVSFGRIDGRDPATPFVESDPARMEAFRQLIREVADEHDRVEVFDLAGGLAEMDEDDSDLRPDGVHLSDTAAIEVGRWLGPALAELHRERTGSPTTLVAR